MACLLVFVIVLMMCITPVFAEETELQILSEMSDEEVFAFLEQYGIEIPEGLGETQADIANIVRGWIAQAEEEPRIYFAYGIVSTEIFANSIVTAVNDYYGIAIDSLPQFYASNGLQYSTVYSTANMSMYNCYAYAIRATGSVKHPGMYITGTALTSNDVKNMDMDDFRDLVLLDIQDYFGYDCVNVTQTRPTSLASGQYAFCIRKGSSSTGVYDYHCMRYDGGVWRHKPGLTALLTYDSVPSLYVNWINEGYNGFMVVGGDVVYSSTIYYFIYQANHDYETSGTGGSVCSNCGAVG